jgi:NAD(P)-dependent dehydrogenase (short-subunit alcohol dehydrogenase family)
METVFLTGGTGKVGKQIIATLPFIGYNVIFTSRSKDKINEIERNYSASSDDRGFVKGIMIDLESPSLLTDLEIYFNKLGYWPSHLINNARDARYLGIERDGSMTDKNWIGEYNLGVIIPYKLSMLFAREQHSTLKTIINIASMYGVVPPNPHLYEDFKTQSPINYGVVKAGMIHLTKELAIRLASNKIRVNSISYGGIKGRTNSAFDARYSELCPQGRMLDEEEVVGSIHFLISANSTAITGHNLICDGGWTVW